MLSNTRVTKIPSFYRRGLQYDECDIMDYGLCTQFCMKPAYLPAEIKVFVRGKQSRLIWEISMELDV